MSEQQYQAVHIPVLVAEVMAAFADINTETPVFLDGTAGEGGHASAILQKFPKAQLILLDRDEHMLQRAHQRLATYSNSIESRCMNFSDCHRDFLNQSFQHRQIDGILLDLGISTYHYEGSGRGFSYAKDEMLDMRLDENGIPAYKILKEYSMKRLNDIFWQYGEERWSKKIASVLVETRKKQPIKTCQQLAQLIAAVIPRKFWPPKSHPATRIFQALRIEANQELTHIQKGLQVLFPCLKEGGIMNVISFHSLEDRIVKNTFREWKQQKKGQLLTKKPIPPTEAEIQQNRAARSAKLRSIRKIELT